MSKRTSKLYVFAALTITAVVAGACIVATSFGKPVVATKADTTTHHAAPQATRNSAISVKPGKMTAPPLTAQSAEPLTGLAAKQIVAMATDRFSDRYEEAGRKNGVKVSARKGMEIYASYGHAAVSDEIAVLPDTQTRGTAEMFGRQLREIVAAYGDALVARDAGTMAGDLRVDAQASVVETMHTVVQGMAVTALSDNPRSADLDMVAALATRLLSLANDQPGVDRPSGSKELKEMSATITEAGTILGRLPENSAAPARKMLESLVADLESVTQ